MLNDFSKSASKIPIGADECVVYHNNYFLNIQQIMKDSFYYYA